MNLFHLLNTKEDILKNVSITRKLMVAIIIDFKWMSMGVPSTVWLPLFFKTEKKSYRFGTT